MSNKRKATPDPKRGGGIRIYAMPPATREIISGMIKKPQYQQRNSQSTYLNLYILNIINADNTSHTRITGLKVIYLSLLINTVKK
jgi:hypothetical protein